MTEEEPEVLLDEHVNTEYCGVGCENKELILYMLNSS